MGPHPVSNTLHLSVPSVLNALHAGPQYFSVPLRRPGFRLDRLAPGETAVDWLATLETFDPARATLLKADTNTAVYRLTLHDNRPIVLKAWDLRPGVPRLKSMTRTSRAWRHWRGASRLLWAGLSTARPLALATERDATGNVVEWLAMDALPGSTLLHRLAELDALPPRRRLALARAVGQQLAVLDAAKLFNRDHKPSNIIVTWPEEVAPTGPLAGIATTADQPILSIIDAVAISPTGSQAWRATRRMAASLTIEPLGCSVRIPRSAQLRALAAYLDAQGDVPRDARRRALRAGWSSITALIRAHGDPTPKVNPLSKP